MYNKDIEAVVISLLATHRMCQSYTKGLTVGAVELPIHQDLVVVVVVVMAAS